LGSLIIRTVAERKLTQLHAAARLDSLRAAPGNRLEALTGDRLGHHGIRINDQRRVCFVWSDEGVTEVKIVDYHRAHPENLRCARPACGLAPSRGRNTLGGPFLRALVEMEEE
jgi:proteic killer suppression protein